MGEHMEEERLEIKEVKKEKRPLWVNEAGLVVSLVAAISEISLVPQRALNNDMLGLFKNLVVGSAFCGLTAFHVTGLIKKIVHNKLIDAEEEISLTK